MDLLLDYSFCFIDVSVYYSSAILSWLLKLHRFLICLSLYYLFLKLLSVFFFSPFSLNFIIKCIDPIAQYRLDTENSNGNNDVNVLFKSELSVKILSNRIPVCPLQWLIQVRVSFDCFPQNFCCCCCSYFIILQTGKRRSWVVSWLNSWW